MFLLYNHNNDTDWPVIDFFTTWEKAMIMVKSEG